MTNFEYIQKRTDGLGLNESDIELILLKGDLIDTDPVDIEACDAAIFNNQSIIRKVSVEKAKEGGYAMERNMAAVDLFLRTLGIESGLISPSQRFGL